MLEDIIAGDLIELKDGRIVVFCLGAKKVLVGYTIQEQPTKIEFDEEDIETITSAIWDTTHEDKVEDKKEKYLKIASNNVSKSEQAFNISRSIADAIPFGQPILVDHHSAAHARRDANRIISLTDKSIELQRKADYYEDKAASLGTTGINSDDYNAPQLYDTKLQKAITKQNFMKKVNKIIRSKAKKYKGNNKKVTDLMALGIKEEQANELLTSVDCFGNLGFADFELTNNGAKIRNTRDKLTKAIIQKAKRLAIKENPEVRYVSLGVTVIKNYQENRLQFEFDFNDLCTKSSKLNVFRGYNRSYNTLQRKLSTLSFPDKEIANIIKNL